MPPSRSGIADYSTLLLPALRERVEEIVVAAPGKRAPRGGRRALPRRQRPRRARLDRRRAARKRPGVVVLHEFVLHHLIAGITIGRGDGRGYLDAMERELGVAGRLLGLGVLDNLLPLLWETAAGAVPAHGHVLDLADGLIVHSRYVEERRARAPATAGRSGGSRTRPGRERAVEPADVERRPARRLLRAPEHEQADPAAARGVRAAAGAAAGRAAAARRRGRRALRPRAAGSSGSASAARRSSASDYVPRGAAVVADGGVRRARQPALADDGRDVRRR